MGMMPLERASGVKGLASLSSGAASQNSRALWAAGAIPLRPRCAPSPWPPGGLKARQQSSAASAYTHSVSGLPTLDLTPGSVRIWRPVAAQALPSPVARSSVDSKTGLSIPPQSGWRVGLLAALKIT